MKPGAHRVRWILAIALIVFACAAAAADPNKVLRVAVNDIDTLDPHQYNDNPSFEVLIAIFEPLYEWSYLESPPKLTPLTATAPIEIADGGKRWTMRVKPGIFFTDDRPSRASHASLLPRITSTRTSAGSTRTGVAAANRSSPTSSLARARSWTPLELVASSIMIVRSRGCARSTAIRSSCA